MPPVEDAKPFKVYVVWGAPNNFSAPEEPTTYEFATKAEADAFTLGVSETNDHDDYNFVPDDKHTICGSCEEVILIEDADDNGDCKDCSDEEDDE